MRRTHLRGHKNILKRQLIHVGAFNLSLILRQLLGAGTPREWKNRGGVLFLFVYLLFPRREGLNGPNLNRMPPPRTKSLADLRNRTRRWVPKNSYFRHGLLRHRKARNSGVESGAKLR